MSGGGWGKRGSGVPLSERRRPGAEAPGPASREFGHESREPCPARHCWVAGAADGRGEKRPGLLIEWRQTATGWEGRVAYAAGLRPGEWALVEEWVPASALSPP